MKNYFKLNIALLSSSLYVAFELFANILSTKIAILPIVNWAVDGGTVIYPLTFTLRDFVHKTWGKKNARQVVIIGALLNAVMFGLFWLVGKMAPDPTWQYQKAYEVILLPVGRIIFASIISQVISELIDTEIFSFVYKRLNDLAAVFFSNFVSLIIDSFVFCSIAFLGVLPLNTVLQIIVANILIKMIISLLSIPTIKLIPRLVNFEEI
ncbi:MAG: queuosine precursor transporter [Candidatus Buchananbacteria bacterium]